MVEASPDGARPPLRGSQHETVIASLLVVCVILVAFWESMSHRSQRPFSPFDLTAESFSEFAPTFPGWTVKNLPVSPDPVEPNIIAMMVSPLRGAAGKGAPVLVRLVHGYNMVDCMRIKGETVTLLADTREQVGAGGGAQKAETGNPQASAFPMPPGMQLWRLESSAARVSICSTAMLRGGDFSGTGVDTRSLAFPRVDVPDNPGWFPQGLTWRSLRHPIANGRLFLRAKWNASRADLLTFLGLRQPAWASSELLTLVAASTETTVEPAREAAVADAVLAAHGMVHDALIVWGAAREQGAAPGGAPP